MHSSHLVAALVLMCMLHYLLRGSWSLGNGNNLQLLLAYKMAQTRKGGDERMELTAEQDLLLQILLRSNGHSRDNDLFPQRVQMPFYTAYLKMKSGYKSYM